MDPQLRVFGNGVGATATTEAFLRWAAVFGGGGKAQWKSLVDLGLVQSHRKDCSRSVILRRRQHRR